MGDYSPLLYRLTYTPCERPASRRTVCYHSPAHSRCTSTAGLRLNVFSGRPPSFQFCYPQALLPPLRCSFTAPALPQVKPISEIFTKSTKILNIQVKFGVYRSKSLSMVVIVINCIKIDKYHYSTSSAFFPIDAFKEVRSPGRTLIETKINWGRRGSPAVKIQCNLKKCGSDYIEFNREPHHRACLRVLESYSEFMLPYSPSHHGIGLPIALYVEHAIV